MPGLDWLGPLCVSFNYQGWLAGPFARTGPGGWVLLARRSWRSRRVWLAKKGLSRPAGSQSRLKEARHEIEIVPAGSEIWGVHLSLIARALGQSLAGLFKSASCKGTIGLKQRASRKPAISGPGLRTVVSGGFANFFGETVCGPA